MSATAGAVSGADTAAGPYASPAGRLAQTRENARRRHAGGFDVAAVWGLLLLLIAGIWLAGPLGLLGGAAVAEAAYVSRLVLHGWVGDLDSVTRFLDLSRQLEPSSLGYWLTAVAAGVAGTARAAVIFQGLLILAVAGLSVALAARRGGGQATGWAFAAAAALVPAGMVVGGLTAGEGLAIALFVALLVLWSERGGIADVMGAVIAGFLLGLMFLAAAPVFAVAACILLLLTLLDGVRSAVLTDGRTALRGSLVRLAFALASFAPALALLALHARTYALDWPLVADLLTDPSAGAALLLESAAGKAREAAVLAFGIGVYGVVVCGFARLIDGAWRREDGLGVAAAVLWLVFFLVPGGGLDTGAGRAVGGLGWVLAALWCGTVGVSLIVRGPALAGLVLLGGLVAGSALDHRERTAPARTEAETVGALLGRDERVLTLDLSADPLPRQVMLLAAGEAGALELNLPSVQAGPEARLVSVNPPLRFAEGYAPADVAGNDPVSRPLFVMPVGWDLPSPERRIQMLAVLGRPTGDDVPWATALGLRVEPFYEPVYRSAKGAEIALYSLRDPGSDGGQ